jgi:hypothetical protein
MQGPNVYLSRKWEDSLAPEYMAYQWEIRLRDTAF